MNLSALLHYGDSVLKLDGSSLAIRDYFTPHDQQRISQADTDIGSSGPTLIPDQPGPHPHLLLQPTKDSTIYVIDRDNMGKYHPDNDTLFQSIKISGPGLGAIAYFNGHAFFAASDDFLRDYAIKNSRLALHATSRAKFVDPAATLPSPPTATRMLSSGPYHQNLERPRYQTRRPVPSQRSKSLLQ